VSQLISHAKFLERLYKLAGTTEQKALAHIANVTSSSMSRIQNGQSMPSIDTLAHIAVVMETSIDYLVGLTDDPTPATQASRALKEAVLSPIPRGPGKPSSRPGRAKRP
jgi:transcriptional regulator with XRE-family HTH domain